MLSYCLFSGSGSNFRGGCHCPPQLSCGSPVIPEGQPLIQSSIILPISRQIPFHLHSLHLAREPPAPLFWPGIDSISSCPAPQPIKGFLFWPLRGRAWTQLLQSLLSPPFRVELSNYDRLAWLGSATMARMLPSSPCFLSGPGTEAYPFLKTPWPLTLPAQLTFPDNHFSLLGILGRRPSFKLDPISRAAEFWDTFSSSLCFTYHLS